MMSNLLTLNVVAFIQTAIFCSARSTQFAGWNGLLFDIMNFICANSLFLLLCASLMSAVIYRGQSSVPSIVKKAERYKRNNLDSNLEPISEASGERNELDQVLSLPDAMNLPSLAPMELEMDAKIKLFGQEDTIHNGELNPSDRELSTPTEHGSTEVNKGQDDFHASVPGERETGDLHDTNSADKHTSEVIITELTELQSKDETTIGFTASTADEFSTEDVVALANDLTTTSDVPVTSVSSISPPLDTVSNQDDLSVPREPESLTSSLASTVEIRNDESPEIAVSVDELTVTKPPESGSNSFSDGGSIESELNTLPADDLVQTAGVITETVSENLDTDQSTTTESQTVPDYIITNAGLQVTEAATSVDSVRSSENIDTDVDNSVENEVMLTTIGEEFATEGSSVGHSENLASTESAITETEEALEHITTGEILSVTQTDIPEVFTYSSETTSSAGDDGVITECLKSTSDYMDPTVESTSNTQSKGLDTSPTEYSTSIEPNPLTLPTEDSAKVDDVIASEVCKPMDEVASKEDSFRVPCDLSTMEGIQTSTSIPEDTSEISDLSSPGLAMEPTEVVTVVHTTDDEVERSATVTKKEEISSEPSVQQESEQTQVGDTGSGDTPVDTKPATLEKEQAYTPSGSQTPVTEEPTISSEPPMTSSVSVTSSVLPDLETTSKVVPEQVITQSILQSDVISEATVSLDTPEKHSPVLLAESSSEIVTVSSTETTIVEVTEHIVLTIEPHDKTMVSVQDTMLPTDSGILDTSGTKQESTESELDAIFSTLTPVAVTDKPPEHETETSTSVTVEEQITTEDSLLELDILTEVTKGTYHDQSITEYSDDTKALSDITQSASVVGSTTVISADVQPYETTEVLFPEDEEEETGAAITDHITSDISVTVLPDPTSHVSETTLFTEETSQTMTSTEVPDTLMTTNLEFDTDLDSGSSAVITGEVSTGATTLLPEFEPKATPTGASESEAIDSEVTIYDWIDHSVLDIEIFQEEKEQPPDVIYTPEMSSKVTSEIVTESAEPELETSTPQREPDTKELTNMPTITLTGTTIEDDLKLSTSMMTSTAAPPETDLETTKFSDSSVYSPKPPWQPIKGNENIDEDIIASEAALPRPVDVPAKPIDTQHIRQFSFSRGLTVGLVLLAMLFIILLVGISLFVIWLRRNRARTASESVIDKFEAPRASGAQNNEAKERLRKFSNSELPEQMPVRTSRSPRREAYLAANRLKVEGINQRSLMRRRQQHKRARLLAHDALIEEAAPSPPCRPRCISDIGLETDAGMNKSVILVGASAFHRSSHELGRSSNAYLPRSLNVNDPDVFLNTSGSLLEEDIQVSDASATDNATKNRSNNNSLRNPYYSNGKRNGSHQCSTTWKYIDET
ncbi:hypothetical protein X801_02224 [Opisthorchis viverrini]|uniref:Uncharacterized protein n=1 Tax=Opisthorchis viverrini TaxID=6198 RepID=A0A1S8X5C8_OPIVI|nr:hypothetical protein X801_02224 [Opisthorchis viverrini]